MRLFAALVACMLSTSAMATGLDCSIIRFVVAFPPGGATDTGTRLMAAAVADKLGKTVVVENKPGGNGTLAAEYVIGAKKDGCTILSSSTTMATFPYMYDKLRFDPFKDLVVVGAIGVTPTLVVTANRSINTLKDLGEWSHKKAGGLNYGSPGVGLNGHFGGEQISATIDAKFQHVPYRGAGQVPPDLISGRIDFAIFAAAGAILQLVEQQQVKAVAVIQPKRSLLVPNVETTAEQGIPNIDASNPFLFYVPKGVSDDAIAQLGAAINQATEPAIRAKLLQLGFEPLQVGPEEGADLLRKIADMWAPVIKRLGLKLD
jgi:tripartite-type tricarboxylate transporter receptor subunit TctC